MLHRIAYRLQYTCISIIVGSVVLLFFKEFRGIGIYSLIGGIIALLFFTWLQKRTEPKHDYEADDKGNAKPKYK